MKKLICDNGHIFDEDEVKIIKESRGEYWGVPCFENWAVCPVCGNDELDDYEEEDEDEEEDEESDYDEEYEYYKSLGAFEEADCKEGN